MTLGEIIKRYREEHDISMDVFAQKSGMSKAYIHILEKNEHPKTKKPIAPSIDMIKKAADGMNMDFNILFQMIDGEVSLKEESGSVLPYSDTQSVQYSGQHAYYNDTRTAEIAQKIFDNKELRLLFDAAVDATPDDLTTTYNMLMALKRKEKGIID